MALAHAQSRCRSVKERAIKARTTINELKERSLTGKSDEGNLGVAGTWLNTVDINDRDANPLQLRPLMKRLLRSSHLQETLQRVTAAHVSKKEKKNKKA